MRKRLSLLLLVCLLLFASSDAAFAVRRDYSVEMSGIPGTMTKIGQTCSLTARTYWWEDVDGVIGNGDDVPVYTWGEKNALEPLSLDLRWSSSTNAARIDQYGNMVSLREGTTTVTVRLYDVSDSENPVVVARDSSQLIVTSELSYTNIHPSVATIVGTYNARMLTYGEQFGFAEINPAGVEAQSFQSAFTARYGVSAAQVREIAEDDLIALESTDALTKGGYEAIKPSMQVEVSAASLAPAGGALLPSSFTYNLSWGEISEVLGRDVSSVGYGELFEKAALVFEDETRALVPVIDGASYADALSGGALRIAESSGGLTLTLEAMLADVDAGTAALIDGRLVIPDGKADGTSGGSIWLVRKSSAPQNEPDDSANGGGGGCDTGASSALLAAIGVGLVSRKRI